MNKTDNIYSTIRSTKFVLKPTSRQKEILESFFGINRALYNISLYNVKNFKFGTYELENGSIVPRIPSEIDLNNSIPKLKEEYSYLALLPADYAQATMRNLSRGFNNFYRTLNYPKFKAKKSSNQSFNCYKGAKIDGDYIILRRPRESDYSKDDLKIRFKRHKIKYNFEKVTGFTISKENNKYYISFTFHCNIESKETSGSVGIDLGIKDFAICSNRQTFKNINKTQKMRRLEKQLKREQKKLSRKYESFKLKNKNKKGEATRQNIQKQIVKVQKLHQRLANIRTDYLNKVVNEIVKTKPSHITIEDLNVSGMMKNKHLSKAIQQQKLYEFRRQLEYKCKWNNIELRIADRFYPSSKLCHCCGSIKKDLKLKDRVYKCDCGYIEDRDYNASLNLRDCKTYKIA